MEYNLIKKSIPTLSFALNTVSEQPVDIDLTLPDYCPDIERILRCCLIPKVYLANVNGDRLNVEGGACVRILYLDSEHGCIRSFEHTTPFSESLPLKDGCDDCAVYVDTKPEYINCRALSPRKLSLHGAFSLYAKVAVKAPMEYYTYEEADDLQVKSEELSASSLRGLCCDSFGIQEDISPGGAEVAALLNHRLTAKITELKAIYNKIMLSGELRLDLMYLSDADKKEVRCMTYTLPVSRVVDCDGVEENSVIDGRLDVLSYDVHLSDDALGGAAVIALDAKLCFNAMCYEEADISVVSDAFSVERDTESSYTALSCRKDVGCFTYTDTGKATVNIEEGVSRVIDVHSERVAVSAAVADGIVLVTAKVGVCILFENTDGETRYVERDVELTYKPDLHGYDTVDNIAGCVDSLSYRILDEQRLELRAEMCYHLTVSRSISRRAVCAVSADDDAPQREDGGSLILYYADGGDSVWDISKKFSSRPADIMAENALDGDTLPEDMMLLITT